ncbi:uncharacterized protein PG998_014507 [Apiospora kogelbergensis]|uniref:uncharacterized protein n=1 Tax=Apiospora kogelbergensis TaxID=1337665 RepID=UPI0031312379
MAPFLATIFEHLVLPVKLPGQQEENLEAIESDIVERMSRACKSLAEHTRPEYTAVWDSVRHTLHTCVDVNRGFLDRNRLQDWFQSLEVGHFLVLHIRCQNAGLLVRREHRDDSDVVIFEVMELSPPSEAVLATENALQREFPGHAVEIQIDEFRDECFQKSLAQFLDQANSEHLYEFAAHASKAGVALNEVRGTVNPALITQMLMPMLEAVGKPSQVPRLRKSTRDDANLSPPGMPWRRLPFWLLIRVAVQRQLYLAHGSAEGYAYYKLLVATMLMHLLQDGVDELALDSVGTLSSKICRRLAKLEMEKAKAVPTSRTLSVLLENTGQMFKDAVKTATDHVIKDWDDYKQRTKRPIPRLPRHAQPRDLQLSLPNSGAHIQRLLNTKLVWDQGRISRALPELTGSMKQFSEFSLLYFQLASSEDEVMARDVDSPQTSFQAECIHLAQSIDTLMGKPLESYNSNAEQMSNLVLKVFERWTQLDKLVSSACPLLKEFHPIFKPELLNSLQISTYTGLRKLRQIQDHLSIRVAESLDTNGSILSATGQDSFAVKYYKQSTKLRGMGKKIEADSNFSRNAKIQEWELYNSNYVSLTQDGQAATCTCSIGTDRIRNSYGCRRCGIYGKRSRLSISIHEDYLPSEEHHKAVALFELEMPFHFAVYRDVTWNIVATLAHPGREADPTPPTTLLDQYEQLNCHLNKSIPRGNITLASIPKSFLGTHYKKQKTRIPVKNVTLPNALKFEYYDKTRKLWTKSLRNELTIQHLCGIYVPQALRSTVIPPTEHPLPYMSGPTSYEIVANQTLCPQDVPEKEFTTMQQLLASSGLRWLTMVRELNSPNLNFSTDETVRFFSALAMQAGPADGAADGLGVVHSAFRDPTFRQLLLDQIDNRLRSISPNWREAPCMEMLLTLSLQLYELDRSETRLKALKLINTIRKTTLEWMTSLRQETRLSEDPHTVRVTAERSLYAALLCRRTFTVLVQTRSTMEEDELAAYVRATIAIQLNLVIDPEKLQPQVKAMLIRDIKLAFRLRDIIRSAIKCCSNGLSRAVNEIWSDVGGSDTQVFSAWEPVHTTKTQGWNNNTWFVSVATRTIGSNRFQQVIHYNCLEGHLLVDGKALGKLPSEIRESEDVKELFGNAHLITIPSRMPGMTHSLIQNPKGHQIHFGLRRDMVVIRDHTREGLLELLPRAKLRARGIYDLPAGLIDDCIHWLHLDSARLEIRRKPNIWKVKKASNWILDLHSRTATKKKVQLVDPHSVLAREVALVFKSFEDPRRLTIYQPKSGSLCVELKHLDLNFAVRDQLLYCRELEMEIDPDQDAGTFYGLESKIVLRGTENHNSRSIITPSGPLTWKRDGIHVAVDAAKGNEYFRFHIDSTLGRLTCIPESRLLYTKALFHAITSFQLPDPLTGRTGSEEALSLLTSGIYQPWQPLMGGHRKILDTISSLTPKREYYPKDKLILQTVVWDTHATTTIQSDLYASVARHILSTSSDLCNFSLPPLPQDSTADDPEPSHLRRRGEFYRSRYERSNAASEKLPAAVDKTYESRDGHARTSPRSVNVYQIAMFLRAPKLRFTMAKDILDLLSKWKFIGGFNETDDAAAALPLDELIDTSVDEQWGNLVNYCRRSTLQTRPRVMLRLCLLAFSRTSNLDMIKMFVAFASIPQLKDLVPPERTSFIDFKVDERPDPARLEAAMKPAYVDYVDVRRLKSQAQAMRRQQHRMNMRESGRKFVDYLLAQWPIHTPAVGRFSTEYVKTHAVLQLIKPEWDRLVGNRQLVHYVEQVQSVLDTIRGSEDEATPTQWIMEPDIVGPRPGGLVVPSLSRDLMSKTRSASSYVEQSWTKGSPTFPSAAGHSKVTAHPASTLKAMEELGRILRHFSTSQDQLRQRYTSDLENSLRAYKASSPKSKNQHVPPTWEEIESLVNTTSEMEQEQSTLICQALSDRDCRHVWLKAGLLWPCTTRITLLEQLQSHVRLSLDSGMKRMLTDLGVLITTLQKLRRMQGALIQGRNDRFLEELSNEGHVGWNPVEYPEWLLIEIDSDLLIRPDQVKVAHAIISPKSERNSLLQMNMGQGKTSVVMPMAASIIANGDQLARLIIPKALLLPTAQVLMLRVGGLLGKSVLHIPFSRKSPTSTHMMDKYIRFHQETKRRRGVVLTTPESKLSYQLSGLQRLKDGHVAEALKMIEFQGWLTKNAREIMDESDFTLAVKTQLIYPSGSREALDGHPQRWEVVENLLQLIEDHLPDLQKKFKNSLNLVARDGGFPIAHILDDKVEEELNRWLIQDIAKGTTPFLRLDRLVTPRLYAQIIDALSNRNTTCDTIEGLSSKFSDPPSAYKNLLLVHGLLGNGILVLCIKKRWNVQYGLHPKRDPIAVPNHRRAATSATSHAAADLFAEVEQEREVEFQVEEIRQVRKPVKYTALEFSTVDDDILKFVKTGHGDRLLKFMHVFESLAETGIGMQYGIQRTLSHLYVSDEFRRTIHLAPGQLNDNFLRPVEWVLWNPSSKLALVVIPEEAEILLETIRRQERPHVHLILYAAPANKSMRSLGDLTFYVVPELPAGYTMPRWLTIELGVFAGRLYIDYGDYAAIRDGILDVYPEADSNDGEPGLAGTITATNPTAFLLDWLTLRRRGQDILHTPMGYLCQGRSLAADHYLFAAVEGSRNGIAKKATQSNGVYSTNGAHDIDDHESEIEEEEHEPRHAMIPEDSN